MGYRFYGFFAAHPTEGNAILEAALKEWPGCKGKAITSPFTGMGFSLPDWQEFTIVESPEAVSKFVKMVEQRLSPEMAECGLDDEGKICEFNAIVKKELVEWSKKFPEATFVYVEAVCFGGDCEYEGYACRKGKVIYGHPDSNLLGPLIKFLDPKLEGEEDFEPLTRGYFD